MKRPGINRERLEKPFSVLSLRLGKVQEETLRRSPSTCLSPECDAFAVFQSADRVNFGKLLQPKPRACEAILEIGVAQIDGRQLNLRCHGSGCNAATSAVQMARTILTKRALLSRTIVHSGSSSCAELCLRRARMPSDLFPIGEGLVPGGGALDLEVHDRLFETFAVLLCLLILKD